MVDPSGFFFTFDTDLCAYYVCMCVTVVCMCNVVYAFFFFLFILAKSLYF